MATHDLRATYRLQLGGDLDFEAAGQLVPYLRRLGISHLYLSPVWQARTGSTHGYDQVDPSRVSEALGGEDGLRALAGAGLGIVLDIVPNHMGTGDENPYWRDEARRLRFFDVDPETDRHRRFFDIDDLAALRQEDDEVFTTTHARVLALMDDGVVDGLRIDHPDGLADPAGYLHRLADAGAEHVWVEKILHPGEPLRAWPVDGTVGYEFLNEVTALFVDASAEDVFTALAQEITGDHRPFAEVAAEAKRQQATTSFAPEVERLRRAAGRAGLTGVTTDVLVEALAGLGVYRTYVEPWNDVVDDADRAAIDAAGMADVLARVLRLDERGADGHRYDEVVTRFQQTSPAVTAKGVEDTAFYRWVRLLALNEVGGDPERFGVSVADFHAANTGRAERFPRGLLVTSTHDTKRSADVRARLVALTHRPDEWASLVRRWDEVTADLQADGTERLAVYQTLVGAWPLTDERIGAYVEKSLREAKVNTNWIEPDAGWEQQVTAFATGLGRHEGFLSTFEPFVAEVAAAGERISLATVLLKLTSPGIPDVYQGDELWDLSLVDPDNRRPVDWAARTEALDALLDGAEPTRRTAKLWLIQRTLDLRGRLPGAFAGRYTPLDAGRGVCAFTRGDDEVLVVVPVAPGADEGDVGAERGAMVEVPAGRWGDVLHGSGEHDLDGPVPATDLVGLWGVGLFERI
jgi:(1->4)-alpha-D-glucan 1-alpha-D-glucosylmutase